MKLASTLPIATLFAAMFTTCAFADDPVEAIKAATKAQNDAPAYRMKIVSTDPATKKVNTITLENVNPDKMHMKVEDGATTQMELVSDGQKTFMAQGGGKMTEAPPQVAAMIVQSRKTATLDAITKMAQDVKFTGHDTVGGVPASVYSFSSDAMGMHSSTKLWISDKDHRPLKAEGETKGQMQTGAPGGQEVNRQMAITFDYDPNIKITLPVG